jgi:hypothetical protein
MQLIWKFWFGSCVKERSKASTPTTSIHLHYCMQRLSFSHSVDRVLSSSRRLYCLSTHFWMHRPPPFTFWFTIHISLHLELYCSLDEWYWMLDGLLRAPTGQDSIPRPLEVPAFVEVVTMLRPSLGLKWPRTAMLSVILTLHEVESQPLWQIAQLEITDMW